jgi:4,5-DOPA dioxygenase extradiol
MRSINDLDKMAGSFSTTEKIPVLFLGHGSPMSAIEENQFVTGFRNLAKNLPKPNAILCVSAHWFAKKVKNYRYGNA